MRITQPGFEHHLRSAPWARGFAWLLRDIRRPQRHNRIVDAPLAASRRIVEGGGHVSAIRVTEAWYIACLVRELGSTPLARTVLGTPLVLFRAEDGKAAALLDRCAHRNVPLSLGRVSDGQLECAYHGWRFDGGGHCRKVPSLCTSPGFKRSIVPHYATRESEGYVWVFMQPDVEPPSEPFRLPLLTERGYSTVRRTVETEATLHATVENALDVPHTAFLHGGLFRGSGERNRIKAIVTRQADRVQTEYVGEPRPEGMAARILAPRGGTVRHFDRFILPSVAQVEYALGEDTHFMVTSICTPIDDFHTRMYAVVSFRVSRLPAWLIKLVLYPVAMKIFGQDVAILRAQTKAIQEFGGENFTSTDLDLMGPQVWRLLRRAEQGKLGEDDDPAWRREIDIEV